MAPLSVTRPPQKERTQVRQSRLREGRQVFRSSVGKLVGKTTSRAKALSDASTECPAQQESSSSSSGILGISGCRSSPSNAANAPVAEEKSGEQSSFLNVSDNLDPFPNSLLCEVSPPTSSRSRSDTTAPPVSRVASRLSETTVCPNEQRDKVDRLLSDAIELQEGRAGIDEFSFKLASWQAGLEQRKDLRDYGGRSPRDSVRRDSTGSTVDSKVDHALEYSEQLLAQCRKLSICEPGSPQHKEHVSCDIDERQSPTSSAKDGVCLKEEIDCTLGMIFDPEVVLSTMAHSAETAKLLEELAMLGDSFRILNAKGKSLCRTEVKRLVLLLESTVAAVCKERQLSNDTSIGSHAAVLSSCTLASGPFSSSSVSSPSHCAEPEHLAHLQHMFNRPCNESVSSPHVSRSGLDSPGHLLSRAPRSVFSSRSAPAPADEASTQSARNSCESPPRSPRRSLKFEVHSPPNHSVSPSRRQASPMRATILSGRDKVSYGMRQVASPEAEASHCPQSAASRIVQTAFGACGPPGPSHPMITASPVSRHRRTASPARQHVMSPSLRTGAIRTPVVAPRLVSPQGQTQCRDVPVHPVAPLCSLPSDNHPKKCIWEPVSVTTSYRLKVVS